MRLILLALVLGFFSPTPATAQGVPTPRLPHGLKLLDEFRLPAGWAGIWEDSDSVFVGCDALSLTNINTDRDTLCEGDELDTETEEGQQLECTGNADDDSYDITCTGSTTAEGCTATFTSRLIGNRNGNTATATIDVVISYSPPSACFELPNICTRIVTRSTRLGPPPEGYCTTPVEATTWGAIKARHR